MVVVKIDSFVRGLHVYRVKLKPQDQLYLTLCRWRMRVHQDAEEDHMKYSVAVKDLQHHDLVVGDIAIEDSFNIGRWIKMGYIVDISISSRPSFHQETPNLENWRIQDLFINVFSLTTSVHEKKPFWLNFDNFSNHYQKIVPKNFLFDFFIYFKLLNDH